MTLTTIKKAGLDELALDHVFTISHSGTSAYTFQGEGLNGTVSNPTLYLTRGKTYRFENVTGAHAIRIQSADNGTNGTLYNTGVTNNNSTGTVIVEVQHDAPDVLYYQCAVHASMKGTLYITGALADGGVTTAKLADNAVTASKITAGNVTTAKIADSAVASSKIADANVTTAKIADGAVASSKIANDAVTQAKIAANAVDTTELAVGAVTHDQLADNTVDADHLQSNAVTTAKIADQAVDLTKLPHGTSSNDGKFLRANNGADPTFESVPSPAITGISNATNNRILTSEGGTTVNSESNLTFDGTTLGHNTGGLSNLQKVVIQGSGNSTGDNFTLNNWGNSDGDYWTIGVNMTANSGGSYAKTNTTLRSVGLNLDGRMGRVIINASETSTSTINDAHTFTRDGSHYLNGSLYLNGDTAAANALDDYEEGSWTATCVSGGSSFTNDSTNNRYVKIGSMVYITGEVYQLVNPNGNTFEIGGLPYQIAQSREGTGSVMTHYVTYGSNRTMATIYIYASQTKFRVYTSGNATSWRAITGSDFSVSGDVIFSFAYHTV